MYRTLNQKQKSLNEANFLFLVKLINAALLFDAVLTDSGRAPRRRACLYYLIVLSMLEGVLDGILE